MGTIIVFFLWLAFAITMVYGWVMNIIWLVGQEIIEASGMMIVSAIGIFIAPLGSIMGLFVH